MEQGMEGASKKPFFPGFKEGERLIQEDESLRKRRNNIPLTSEENRIYEEMLQRIREEEQSAKAAFLPRTGQEREDDQPYGR